MTPGREEAIMNYFNKLLTNLFAKFENPCHWLESYEDKFAI